MKKTKDVLVVSIYRGHRAAEHLRFLDDLRGEGLIGKINVLESNGYKGYEYPFDISGIVDYEIIRDAPEGTVEVPGDYLNFKSDLLSAVSRLNPDLVIPTSDAGVYVVSDVVPFGKRSSPSLDVVDAFQDKFFTNLFLGSEGVVNPLEYFRVDNIDMNDSEKRSLDDFIGINNGVVFAKPMKPRRGGGIGGGQIHGYKDLQELINDSPLSGEYILSKVLFDPEFSHTVVVNKSGKVISQGTYFYGEDGIETVDANFENFNDGFSVALLNRYGKDSAGAYNIDFMRDEKGELRVVEVNPGRFPANLGAFRNGEFNPLKGIVNVDNYVSENNVNRAEIGHVYKK